jgi:hypothetical protein
MTKLIVFILSALIGMLLFVGYELYLVPILKSRVVDIYSFHCHE